MSPAKAGHYVLHGDFALETDRGAQPHDAWIHDPGRTPAWRAVEKRRQRRIRAEHLQFGEDRVVVREVVDVELRLQAPGIARQLERALEAEIKLRVEGE